MVGFITIIVYLAHLDIPSTEPILHGDATLTI